MIPVAHDFICGWCWIGSKQFRALRAQFDVKFDYLSYELYPEEMDWPESSSIIENPNKPTTPSRFQFMQMLEGHTLPKIARPKRMRSHNALEAAEYVKLHGDADTFIERMYIAFWEAGVPINEPSEILKLARGLVSDLGDLEAAISERRFADKIVPFDRQAYASGVFNLPTYFIGGERYAEQPTQVIAEAIQTQLRLSA